MGSSNEDLPYKYCSNKNKDIPDYQKRFVSWACVDFGDGQGEFSAQKEKAPGNCGLEDP